MEDERWRMLRQPAQEITAAHEVLDELGVPRDSADDEMPPGAELDLAERIRRLAKMLQKGSPCAP